MTAADKGRRRIDGLTASADDEKTSFHTVAMLEGIWGFFSTKRQAVAAALKPK
jgi:hypothetical protein